jgi:glycosyltransferase involved in cell wall biosynthesis
MKILLHDNSLTERGTTVAVTAYARALRDLQGASVEIAYRQDAPNRPEVIQALSQELDLVPYQSHDALQRHVSSGNHDYFYAIKAGGWDGVTVRGPRNLIHAVFQEYQPHGDRYAYVSQWLARTMQRNLRKRMKFITLSALGRSPFVAAENATHFDYVPHIVQPRKLQSDFRNRLNLPSDAIVIGSLSGSSQFDIPFVRDWLLDRITRHTNTFFVGPNIRPFADHPRMLFLPTFVDMQLKFDYLRSLDVLLHARSMGETFGLAIAEAAAVGTPVLAFQGGRDRNHVEMLANTNWLYADTQDLDMKFTALIGNPLQARSAAVEIARPFSPEAVIRKFTQVFLK